jgi:signal transduction histidine kinase
VYRIHDLSPGEPVDIETGLEYYHPGDREQVRNAVDRALSEGELYEHTVRLITNAGRERWVHSVGEPVKQDGEVATVRGVFQDVTERKQNKLELARQNEQLEQFTGIVSHDLRNPLNVIEGRMELLEDEHESKHTDVIDDAIDRMNRIIDDALWLAQEGKDIRSTEAVPIQDAAESAWHIVADTVDHAQLRYEVSEDQLPIINADSDRLDRLLENLFRNAIDHGGKDVTVTVGGLDNGFYVEDDGPGIPAEQRDEVFTPGYSEADEGTGLGLEIVRQVVEAHGWDIRITEGVDGGARFEITNC